MKVTLNTTNLINNSVRVGINVGGHESVVTFPIHNLSDENHRKLLAILNDHFENNMGINDLANLISGI